jgi:hypothetical protein
VSELRVSLDGLVDEIVERVVAELDGHAHAAQEEAEPWRLLSLEEAAARLGRSPRWVRDHKDAIGWVKLGEGSLLFDPEDVRLFARARRVGPAR